MVYFVLDGSKHLKMPKVVFLTLVAHIRNTVSTYNQTMI